MRIGFVGTHSTGKTALAKELLTREEFRDYAFVPSSSRVLSTRLATSRDAMVADQLAITLARISDEETYSMGGTRPILSERTPLDSLAYTTYQVKNVWEGDHKWVLDVSEGAVKSAMRQYDLVCYFPVYWPVEDDGLRDQDEEYRKMINVYAMMWLTKFGIKPYVMQNTPVDKRADYLVSWMKRRM
jgi:nicotinamide riboside kinase